MQVVAPSMPKVQGAGETSAPMRGPVRASAARVVGGETWRDLMGLAREVAWSLRDDEVVVIQQGGQVVWSPDARGPLRIAPGPRLLR